MFPFEKIDKSWHNFMESAMHNAALQHLYQKVLPNQIFHPNKEDILNVFKLPLKDIKVVILGTDPYSNPAEATGEAFLSQHHIPPKELQMISKEIIASDYDHVFSMEVDDKVYKRVSPSIWTQQGVFLLNSALTVESRKPGSHLSYWKSFMVSLISHISIYHNCIWLLWGDVPKWFEPCIQSKRLNADKYFASSIEFIPKDDFNYVFTAPHPSVKGFLGCNHFYFVNRILEKQGKTPIIW